MSTRDDEVLVVRGVPDDASLAALVTVLAMRAAAAAASRPPARSPWLGETWLGGPDAWRLSGLPH